MKYSSVPDFQQYNKNSFYKLQEIEHVNVQIIFRYLYIIALLRCSGTYFSLCAKGEAF